METLGTRARTSIQLRDEIEVRGRKGVFQYLLIVSTLTNSEFKIFGLFSDFVS
jgi:hypothetical protein